MVYVKRMVVRFPKTLRILFLVSLLLIVVILNYFKPPTQTNELENVYFSTFKGHDYFHGYLLEPRVCSGKSFEIVLVITSYVGNVALRSAHRRAIPQLALSQLNVTRIFSLAVIPNSDRYITQESVRDEHWKFGDILQGGFIENYRNLTYKHIMSLNWTSINCHTKFIVKADDDTVFIIQRLQLLLQSIKYRNSEDLLLGFQFNNAVPKRDPINKWYVSNREYSDSVYPSYLSGWLYATIPNIAKKLVTAATYRSYFWIDDIFITGILAMDLNLALQDIKQDSVWLKTYEQLECCLRDMNHGIQCNYFIGTNGGRDNMIYDFYQAWRKCFKIKCKLKEKHDVMIDCILTGERIQSEGKADIKSLKL